MKWKIFESKYKKKGATILRAAPFTFVWWLIINVLNITDGAPLNGSTKLKHAANRLFIENEFHS